MNKDKIEKSTTATKILKQYDKIDKNPDLNLIKANIAKRLLLGRPIELLSFTCSTINSRYMFSKTSPELYVSTDPEGNNMNDNIQELNDLARDLREAKVNFRFIVIIGNTDPYYIYSRQTQEFPNLDKSTYLSRFAPRWKIYMENFNRWIENRLDADIRVISWFEIEMEMKKKECWNFETLFNRTYKRSNSLFRRKDVKWEMDKLKDAFGKGKYFEGLNAPNNTILRDWVLRKFSEYAVQGLWLKRIWPEGILIQNEFPALLRYQMYQPLIKQQDLMPLPNIFMFGKGENRYQ